MILRTCILAWRDYCHEKLLSACAILSLAAMLAPLLVLYGVKFGVISTMTDRLQNDPSNLEVIPVASGHYTPNFLQQLAQRQDVAFVLPRTRAIAATMNISPDKSTDVRQRLTVSLEPTATGDVLLARHMSTSLSHGPKHAFPITLSAEAARKLHVTAGALLQGRVERLQNGKVQQATVQLWVQAVLPLEAQQKDVAFVPLSLLEATEDYRDGRKPATDSRLSAQAGWTGENHPTATRVYPAFRLYARSLEDVENLRQYFATQRIEVYTQAEQIAAVRSLSLSLNLIFGLISTAAALGFLASTSSSSLAAVRRKERYLGIIRLMGYSSTAIMTFPLFQSVLTALLGTALALSLYSITAQLIDKLFAHSLQGVEQICSLPLTHMGIALGLVLALSLLATLLPAWRAARIEPSEVIRDI